MRRDRSSGEQHAFLYDGTGMTDLGALGGTVAIGYAVNDAGQVTGVADDASGEIRAFLYDGGVMMDLGTLPGSIRTDAYAINNAGQVVGFSAVAGRPRAFLYSGGVMTDLNDLIDPGLGWELISAHDINDSGQIVGVGVLHVGGPFSAFLMTPLASAPIPGTLALFAMGALAGVGTRRRHGS